jgi:hypothetical protein
VASGVSSGGHSSGARRSNGALPLARPNKEVPLPSQDRSYIGGYFYHPSTQVLSEVL